MAPGCSSASPSPTAVLPGSPSFTTGGIVNPSSSTVLAAGCGPAAVSPTIHQIHSSSVSGPNCVPSGQQQQQQQQCVPLAWITLPALSPENPAPEPCLPHQWIFWASWALAPEAGGADQGTHMMGTATTLSEFWAVVNTLPVQDMPEHVSLTVFRTQDLQIEASAVGSVTIHCPAIDVAERFWRRLALAVVTEHTPSSTTILGASVSALSQSTLVQLFVRLHPIWGCPTVNKIKSCVLAVAKEVGMTTYTLGINMDHPSVQPQHAKQISLPPAVPSKQKQRQLEKSLLLPPTLAH